MQFHWKVLLWMVAGVLVGLVMQATLEGPSWIGARFEVVEPGAPERDVAEEGVVVASVAAGGPAAKGGLRPGAAVVAAVRDRGAPGEERRALEEPEDVASFLAATGVGDVVWFETAAGKLLPVAPDLDPDSPRAGWIAPFDFLAEIFISLLKMLIVPLVLTSIVTGVAGVGSLGDLRRLGIKTFGYYMATSLLAILVGQMLVNALQPGDGAVLGLTQVEPEDLGQQMSFVDVLRRMIPQNIFAALTDNSAMLEIIFFALLFGVFVTRAPEPHGSRVRDFFASAFEVMLRMAEGILKLLPYGVFCLLVRVVATTGFASFEPLLLYMLTVLAALLVHSTVTLPLILKLVGRISPRAWFRAMSPALMTAFSTSSSSMTLPVTLETVEKRGRVSNKITSFTLPLGATINMDGTALYECIGVIFLAQYYAHTGGFELTLGMQGMVVLMALLASVGAAGIPSAGLVMMLTILSALGLPVEGAALLLAVDRPLDMLRTTVNVWSDSCAAAVVARSEGETGPLEAGAPEPEPGPA